MSEAAEGPEPGAGRPVEERAVGPAPLGVVTRATGEAEVDVLIERLRDADALPTDGHLAVYEDVHRGLRDALTALDNHRS